MAMTNARLRRLGYDDETINLARVTQEAETRVANERVGRPRSMQEILAGEQAKPRRDAASADFTAQYLRRRGRNTFGQAAFLATPAAAGEPDPERRASAQAAAHVLAGLSGRAAQLEFDLLRRVATSC
jgi:hypothetical protein